jgi:hypothetical protein
MKKKFLKMLPRERNDSVEWDLEIKNNDKNL